MRALALVALALASCTPSEAGPTFGPPAPAVGALGSAKLSAVDGLIWSANKRLRLTGASSLEAVNNSTGVVVFLAPTSVAAGTWSSMPAAQTLFSGLSKIYECAPRDLTTFTHVRLISAVDTVACAAGGELRLMYSLDAGTTLSFMDGDGTAGNGTGPINLCDSASTFTESAYTALHANAKITGALVCLLGADGNGATSPRFGRITAEFY